MFLDHADFHQQQGMVMARMAQHERRYGQMDTTEVVQILTNLIPRTPRDSVVSDALLTALSAIEADIDRHMKEQQADLADAIPGMDTTLNTLATLSIRK